MGEWKDKLENFVKIKDSPTKANIELPEHKAWNVNLRSSQKQQNIPINFF